jgi:hypothetical protein
VVDSLLGGVNAITLSPSLQQLKTVSIKFKKPVLINVGSKLKSRMTTASFMPGMDVAMFMQGSENVSGIIKSVGFYLKQSGPLGRLYGDATAPFRVRVFERDSVGRPGKEILDDVLIVSGKKRNDWCEVDVSGYNIENPTSGFFVCFSFLSFHYYISQSVAARPAGILTSNYSIPLLSFATREFKETLTYTRTYGGSRDWRKDKGMNMLFRATVASY